jgi:uncharacterized protein (TIGR00106 family)
MPVIMDVHIVPVGKEGASMGDTVVETVKVAEAEGVTYRIGPMGTTLEGDLATLLRVAQRMHEVCFRMGYPRVITSLRIDDRRDKDLSMNYKVESVGEKLAKQATHIRES